MKIAGRKIPRGTFFLFLSFMMVSLCLLLIVSATRTERINNLSQNLLYTGHERNFYIKDADEESLWEKVMPELASQHKDFAIYVPMQDPEIVMRGICVKGRVQDPPMIEGRFFNFDTSWSDTPRIVLGKDCREGIVERDSKKYYSYGGTDFEVLGVMGTEEESRLNHMALLDFRSAVRMMGINTDYMLDAKKEPALVDVAQDMHNLFRRYRPADVGIHDAEAERISFIARLLSSDAVMDTMYVMILVSFSLSTILVTFIWLRFRRPLFFAWQLCGYGERMKGLETAKRYYLAAGIGFAAGLFLMALCSLLMEEIQVKAMDIVQAFGMTVGLGTVILFFCYLMDRRGLKK